MQRLEISTFYISVVFSIRHGWLLHFIYSSYYDDLDDGHDTTLCCVMRRRVARAKATILLIIKHINCIILLFSRSSLLSSPIYVICLFG